jgi:hypothetical protein
MLLMSIVPRFLSLGRSVIEVLCFWYVRLVTE